MSEAELIAAIVASPDDDVPRTVFADWLEEQGDPRGAFIRAQQTVGLGDSLSPAYFDALRVADRLENDHRASWLKRLPAIRNARFERGFVSEATMLATAFLKKGEALLERAPVERLRLQRVKGRGEELAAAPALKRLRGLDFTKMTVPDADQIAILGSPNLTALSTYGSSGMSTRVRNALLGGAAATSLQDLTLSGVPGALPDVSLPRLERLTSHGDRVAKLAPLRVPALTSFTIATYQLMTKDLTALTLPPLASLSIRAAKVKRGVFSTLAEHEAFGSLTSFRFATDEQAYPEGELDRLLTADALNHCAAIRLPRRLADSASLRGLPNLTSLRLGVYPGGLAKADPRPLADLALSGILDDNDMTCLIALAPTLRSLSLACEAPRDSWERLFRTTFPVLGELNITDDVTRTTRGVRTSDLITALSNKCWPRLLSLKVRGVDSQADGFADLAKAVKGSSLRRLTVYDRVKVADALALVLECPHLVRLHVAGSRIVGAKKALQGSTRIRVDER